MDYMAVKRKQSVLLDDNQYIEFHFSELHHEKLSGIFSIGGSFPVVTCRAPHLRLKLDKKTIEKIDATTLRIIDSVNSIGVNLSKDYVQNLATTAVKIAHCMAGLDPDSTACLIFGKVAFWWWSIDDTLEDYVKKQGKHGIRSPSLIKEINHVASTLESVLKNKGPPPNLSEVAGLPNFPQFMTGLARAVEYLYEYLEPMGVPLTHFVTSQMRCFLAKLSQIQIGFWNENSPDSFLSWRRWDGGGDWLIEISAALRHVVLSEEIRSHPLLLRFTELGARILGLTNDVLGIAKDFDGMDYAGDSLVSYLIFVNNLEPQEAVDSVLETISSNTRELVGLRGDILRIFGKEDGVKGYLDTTIVCCNGFIYFQFIAERYIIKEGQMVRLVG